MDQPNEDINGLWLKIECGSASEQEKIDAAALSGESKDPRYIPNLLRLVADEEGQVRYYALQGLVLDLHQADRSTQDLCWHLLREDPDEDVRAMAAACLGKIHFGARSKNVFHRLLGELKSDHQPRMVKGGLYTALFKLAGRPPLEWPRLMGPRKIFEETDIDWEKVAWLEDQMEIIVVPDSLNDFVED